MQAFENVLMLVREGNREGAISLYMQEMGVIRGVAEEAIDGQMKVYKNYGKKKGKVKRESKNLHSK